jgi:hypothetical protein
MPDRPTLPEPSSDWGAAQFRADLAAYLDSLFLHDLADLLGELPEPTRVALMHELSERGPAWAKLPEDWPQLPRRSLRERLADRRAARQPPSPEQLHRWWAEADRAADQLSRQRRSGAVAERRVAEALRAWGDQPRPGRTAPAAGGAAGGPITAGTRLAGPGPRPRPRPSLTRDLSAGLWVMPLHCVAPCGQAAVRVHRHQTVAGRGRPPQATDRGLAAPGTSS